MAPCFIAILLSMIEGAPAEAPRALLKVALYGAGEATRFAGTIMA